MCSIFDIAPINVSGRLGVKDFIKHKYIPCTGKYGTALLDFKVSWLFQVVSEMQFLHSKVNILMYFILYLVR